MHQARIGALEAQSLLDDCPDYVFAKDAEGRYLYMNRSYAGVLGVEPDALIGKPARAIWSPTADVGESFVSLDRDVLEGKTVRDRLSAAYRDGVRYVWVVHKTPLRAHDGAIVGVLTYARDVTELHRTEETLRASEARYRLLLEHSPVAMYVHDGAKILYANRAFATFIGAPSPEAMIGYSVLALAHPDDVPALTKRLRSVKDGTVVSPAREFRVMGVDGRELYAQVLATSCIYEGKPAVQVVMVDETERRRVSAERDTLQDQLRHAQRLEALGTLAGGIAHDFNNMLTIITASAELAKLALPADHGARRDLAEILIASDRAAALVRGILAFSRKEPIRRGPVKLADVVLEATRLLRSTLPAGIALDVEIGADDVVILADATQVQQALLNLCTNAWHALVPERPGRIRVTMSIARLEGGALPHPELRQGPHARIDVKDNGSGMDDDTRARVFDPFFTTKPTGQGTGLGLSVVHGIMRAHEGAITVTSAKGVGSEFTLYFPMADAQQSARAPRASREPIARLSVLLVDDESAIRGAVGRALEERGHRVKVCTSFADAASELEGNAGAYDALFLDHNMPGGSGLDLAEIALRANPSARVVIASGFLDDAVRVRAGALGVRVLLDKPFTIDEAIDALARP